MAERQKIATKKINLESKNVTFTFVGGTVLQVDWDKVPDDLKLHAGLHGLSQKIGDTYAGAKGDVNGAIEDTQSLIEQIYGGEWSAEREAAGPRPSMVAEAVIAAKKAAGQTFDEEATRAKYLGKDSAANRKKALDNAQVRAEYEKLRLAEQQKRAAEAATAAGQKVADVSDL